MKLKKILAAMAASALVVSMLGMAASATDDEVVTDLVEEEEVTEEVTEEVIEEEVTDEVIEEETEIAPEDEADNADTGNAPIALAVIPVALAAAAIVAKKAK